MKSFVDRMEAARKRLLARYQDPDKAQAEMMSKFKNKTPEMIRADFERAACRRRQDILFSKQNR